MIKSIIFDFDGVIAESVHVKTQAFSLIYSPYGKDVVNKVVAHHLANGGVSRIEKFKLYHKKFLCKNLSNQQVEDLEGKFSDMVVEKVINAPYVKGAYKFLSENHGKYIILSLLERLKARLEKLRNKEKLTIISKEYSAHLILKMSMCKRY